MVGWIMSFWEINNIANWIISYVIEYGYGNRMSLAREPCRIFSFLFLLNYIFFGKEKDRENKSRCSFFIGLSLDDCSIRAVYFLRIFSIN